MLLPIAAAALLLSGQTVAPPVQGTVSGSASPASRGGAGSVDPLPGYSYPTPSVVGGRRAAQARAAGEPTRRVPPRRAPASPR